MKKTPLRSRSAPLRSREPARGGAIKRKRRVKTSNAKRRKSEFARCYHSDERVAFVQGLPCLGCTVAMTRSVNAHISGDGVSRKAPYTAIIPLCFTCHGLQHFAGWSVFRGLNTPEKREAAAARTEELWLAHLRQTGRARQEAEGNV